MMPLIFADLGETYTIQRIGGSREVRSHLENMGFVTGGKVSVINTVEGNLIVNVKEVRVALNKELAQKIMI